MPRKKSRPPRSRRGPNAEKNKKHRHVQFKRARLAYRLLIKQLGGTCCSCGTQDPTLLTVDHINGVTYDRYKLRYDARVYRYIEEYLDGTPMRVLCLACNGRFGRPTPLTTDPLTTEPHPSEDLGPTPSFSGPPAANTEPTETKDEDPTDIDVEPTTNTGTDLPNAPF